jgi:adenine phosphoribosyltransferase
MAPSDSVADGLIEELRAKIREVPGFPREDILFYDITTLLKDAQAFKQSIDLMAQEYRESGVDIVVAMESRGFIFGAPLAYVLGAGFAPIRKIGKLPAETIVREYTLEYATNTFEIHRDAIGSGRRILMVDDLLATGGTLAASLDMVQELGGIPVGVVVLVELTDLHGRDRLKGYDVPVRAFIRY